MSKTQNFRKIILVLGDISLLYASLFIAVYFGFWQNFESQIFLTHITPFSILYFFWLIIFFAFGLYDLNLIRKKLLFYPRFFASMLFCAVSGIIFFYLITDFGIAPKTNLALCILIFSILFFCWRKFFYNLFSSRFTNKTIIIGDDKSSRILAKEIQERPWLGYKIIDILPQNENSIIALKSKIRKEKIDTLILSENLESNSKILEELYQFLPLQVNFIHYAKAYETITQKIPVSLLTHAWFLENLKQGEKNFYNKIKRILDIISASIILIIACVFTPFIALAIKLEDKGPIFYKHQRIGKNRKPFLLIKFRSMKENSEKNGAVWAEKQDERITKTGKFLRKTHLDEIPQMLNILKGDISLVGPRPERPEFIEKLEKEIPYYHIRHLIKPGFTGWAQIKFRYSRSVVDSKEKFQYDLYYIKNNSLFLDIGILLKTFQLFFKKE
jgi:exopolysaccharide biosynthesis polyprenyl glycosylphosphotransferase